MAKSVFDDIIESLKAGWNLRLPSLSSGSGIRKGFRNPFVTEADRERKQTRTLYDEVRQTYDASLYAREGAADEFIFNIIIDACERADVTPSIRLGEALWATVRNLLIAEGSIFGFLEVNFAGELTLEEGVALRSYLHRKRRFLGNHEHLIGIWREKTVRLLDGIVGYLPPAAFEDGEEETADDLPPAISVALIDLCASPAELVERVMFTMFDDDITDARLFDPVRARLDRNAMLASGIASESGRESSRAIILPTAAKTKSNRELVETYLAGTPLAALFLSRFPFDISFPVRFEHALVVGGTGHGKTQLLQLLIYQDLIKAQDDGRAVVVIDSQGDLVRAIARLSVFDPKDSQSLAERLLIVDPTDVEYPVCLNLFDWNRSRLTESTPLDREKVLNSAIALYEYLFGALLGAELTQRQGVIFKYLARLMLEIPQATIHTLRQLMEDGEPFRPHMEKLQGSARSFFETRFFDRSFGETKKQILTRLWGVLSNATLERMFSHPQNKVDMFEAINTGKVVLINTSKELLGHDGSAILGRFFIALLSQAALQRAAIPPHERRPAFVYIDEAADYFDDSIEHLLNQARKYRLGMILAHQNLDQLSSGLRASVMASTSTKLIGGVSAKDAGAFAGEMRSDPDFIGGMRKRKDHTDFACFVKNETPQAICTSIPLGFVENMPTLADANQQTLLDRNRARYCAHFEDIAIPVTAVSPPSKSGPRAQAPKPVKDERATVPPLPRPVREAPPISSLPLGPTPQPPAPAARPLTKSKTLPGDSPPLGRGGRQHQYLQQLLKGLAEERGFRAVIEEEILNGAGRADVSLTRDQLRIAFEISVTTRNDQELQNMEKCLAAGYAQVALIATDRKHLSSMERFINASLNASERERVRYLLPDAIAAYLDEFGIGALPAPEVVRGYKVKVTRRGLTEAETLARRQAIAGVLARSLRTLRS